MRDSVPPKRPSARISCCLCSSKTLLMPATEPAFRARVNVSAGSVNCRFWVSTEGWLRTSRTPVGLNFFHPKWLRTCSRGGNLHPSATPIVDKDISRISLIVSRFLSRPHATRHGLQQHSRWQRHCSQPFCGRLHFRYQASHGVARTVIHNGCGRRTPPPSPC